MNLTPHLGLLSVPLSQKPKRRVIHMAAPVDKKTQCSRDHIHIRELTVSQGGLGCAIWDGSIVLARWVHQHPSVFQNGVGIELGAGVGLPGIACARHARTVVLTDYMEEVVSNLAYNLKLNSNVEAEAEDDECFEDDEIERRRVLRRNVRASGSAALLDWHSIDPDEEDLERMEVAALDREDPSAASSGDAAASSSAPASPPAISSHSLDTLAARLASLSFTPSSHFIDPTGLGPASCDFLLGAELIYTYNKHHQHCFLRILSYFLVPGGRYYCVQSRNREGMPEFVADLLEAGFRVWWQPALVESGMVAPFPGEKQPKGFVQREEQYVFYIIQKPGGPVRSPEDEAANLVELSLPCGTLVDAAVSPVPRVTMLRDAEAVVAEKQAIDAIVGEVTEAGAKLLQGWVPKSCASASSDASSSPAPAPEPVAAAAQ